MIKTLTAALLLIAVAVVLQAAEPVGPAAKPRFDHFTTGFELLGPHARTDCAACHAGGVFQGVPTDCAGCHGRSGLVSATRQPAHHMLTTNQCASCHTPNAWTPVARVDHLETIGTCASCHNGVRVFGQPVNHLPTSEQCDACHNTRSFSFARFNHAATSAQCFACHDGARARGKPPDHIPASNFCEACHNTMSFGRTP